ncbi:MAG: DUF2844 domain-containing protein [Candidatus Competibacteraceae bacterium]
MKLGLFATVVAVAAVLPALARAELGGTVDSAQNDAVQLQGTLHSVASQGYTLHEIRTPTGHTVSEYASTDGTIFGVSWAGPTIPDLRQLLGETYFAKFQQAAAERKRYGRGPVLLETPDFVFQQTGHIRDFRGRAYLPKSLPPGVDASAIR